MPDLPTIGELVRRLEDRYGDVRDDLHVMGARVDSRVSMERYQIEQAQRDDAYKALLERVKSIEDARRDQERLRAADRRLILSGLVVPVLVILLQVYLSTRGAGV
ncbi:hypothetical protein [Streptomyces sp. CBMA152]|uniref:hypothetical protein n=1 Tax=Streptomyces sp. CBMA152 TaxID=1896312 RepID=UPI001661333B|nr:hypothetical protein [Streptomyces sp. CBMA152]MBD0743612.1 hypothetical protein [Streptomyces sp. CBMA152]